MAIVFKNIPLKWLNKGVEPTEEKKQSGFEVGYAPPAEYHNYMFANAFDCIAELQETESNADDRISELENNIVDQTQYASHSQLGVVQFRKTSSGKEHSGIADYGNGIISVCHNTEKGITISGSNEVITAAATREDIDGLSNAYKPIVPSTLGYAVETITGFVDTMEHCPADVDDIATWLNKLQVDQAELAADINTNASDITTLANEIDDIKADMPNIKKNPNATDGDIIDTHLTVGLRNGDVGYRSFVSGGYTDSETGEEMPNVASGYYSACVGGFYNSATNSSSVVLGGQDNTASSINAVIVGGNANTASGLNAVTLGGHNLTALANQIKGGHYCTDGTAGTEGGTSGDAFILGNGMDNARSNCLRVAYSGYVYGGKSFGANSADVAEMYEWLDGNPNNEDRRGLFVTLDGTKIKLASPTDTYIKGVISAQPALVGDVGSDNWHNMYLKDVFGAYLKDDNGNYIVNPEYDPEQEYIPREERPEYDYVSNWGKLVLVDDGTCEVNGFATVGEGGKATKSDVQTLYRVMERRDDTHIYVSVG